MALGADLTAQLSRIRGIRLGDLLQIFIKRYLLPYWSSLDLSSLEGRVFVEGELGRGKISVAPRGALLLIVPYSEVGLPDAGERLYYCFFDKSGAVLPDLWSVGGISFRQSMNDSRQKEVFGEVVRILERQFS